MFALSSLSQWEKDNHLLIWNVIQSELRNYVYDDIQPGFHMSKTHWNTIALNESVSDALVKVNRSFLWINL
jgi:predicted DNA-binding protein (MmcQ/YjbR family)